MEAGKLDRRIRLLRATSAKNEFNEPVEVWSTLCDRFAEVEHVSDGERTRAAETGAVVQMRFRIRYSSEVADLNPKDRLQYPIGGREFNIIGVKELQRRVGLEISATARGE